MPLVPSVQNHFQEGLKTEFTGLNFPENATTDSQNCVYTLVGDVLRRQGINFEANNVQNTLNSLGLAVNSYRWTNVGGDGLTQMLVVQVGGTLYFYLATSATIASPLSAQLLASIVTISNFQAGNNSNNVAITECQFTDGNGYLIVFHKDCDPFYCTYNSANQSITPTIINIKIRDFVGIPEVGVADNFRPNVLTREHQYNLINQGWSSGTPWTAVIYNNGDGNNPGPSNPFAFPQGTFDLSTNSLITIPVLTQTNTTSITNGSIIQLTFNNPIVTGAGQGNAGGVSIMNIFVNSYVTPFTSITGNIQSATINLGSGLDTSATPYVFNYADYYAYVKFDNHIKHSDSDLITATLVNVGFVQNWFTQVGNYPSNSDVWWLYKNTTNVFDPQHQLPNVQQSFGPAPKGYFIMNAFNQDRSNLSGVAGLTAIRTTARPTNGCWFQGRVFYTGVNASQQAAGDQPYTTWTENIYFSQIIDTPNQFGNCYQLNDPTAQNLFTILPTDGGVITIQGSGSIYKLFPLENGLLVFAANGIWFITGSQGIGFSASDYTIRKISNIQNIGYSSYVNINGYPMFWNEEGIYYVTPTQQGVGMGANATSLSVQNLALGTILGFYQKIPKTSKVFARGDYNIVNFVAQWCYRSTVESGINNRYQFDTILAFNVITKAFYYYTVSSGPLSNGATAFVNDVKFIQNPGGSGAPSPVFKYLTYVTPIMAQGAPYFTFSEENDAQYVDWRGVDTIGLNFTSYFISGYTLPGKAIAKDVPVYVIMYLRNTVNNSYRIQSVWNFATHRNSGKYSDIQLIQDNTNTTNFGMTFRRHKLRGEGMSLQIKVQSFAGKPFDIMGWTLLNSALQSV